jgi:DNA repair protein RecO (recombination protein O)
LIHKTKGIVLRTLKYGETSIIATVYTELFGIQSYIVKGIRQAVKKTGSKAIYFQPAAILDMVVYHNELKNLQFIKEYQWGYLFEHVLFDVVKNTVALYIVELLQHSLKQPEANPEMYYLAEDTLKQLDKGSPTLTANLPLYFTLHLAGELGFRIQGEYGVDTPVVDLQEGVFIADKPNHPHYLDSTAAKHTSQLLTINFYNDLEKLLLSRSTRRELLAAYQGYLALHIQDFGELKSWAILQEVLG